ncbi:flagellar hook-basal body complex protein FliE [Paenibacillus selenitireducens]|uniref:Flagellar hook-basal body complex protein FliE n=1 Tax=Paenibacillus selenitireducens TaxID=1324314 RepID=A0A1T2XCH3_9BACL|nr:flagellar hook-basal body complex protein FliE [Paenibacillus selenitireducens]OPA77591.1 flagellar hook-basal body complex protein FliE [Paenibacillus selenitireducens]
MIQNTMLTGIQPKLTPTVVNTQPTPAQATKQFSEFLGDALDQIDAQEKNVHQMSDKFILGQVNVDQLMIASEQATLSLQLTTQIRNKVIEAYQEIMRTQI